MHRNNLLRLIYPASMLTVPINWFMVGNEVLCTVVVRRKTCRFPCSPVQRSHNIPPPSTRMIDFPASCAPEIGRRSAHDQDISPSISSDNISHIRYISANSFSCAESENLLVDALRS